MLTLGCETINIRIIQMARCPDMMMEMHIIRLPLDFPLESSERSIGW